MAESHAQPSPFRPRVPRWMWFVVVCVALGAMTSVGVAWGIAWRFGPILYGRVGHDRGEHLQNPFGFEEQDDMGCKAVGDIAPNAAVQSLKYTYKTEEWPLVWYVYRSERFGVASNFFSSGGGPPAPGERETFDRFAADPMSQRAIRRHVPLLHAPEVQCLYFTVVTIGWPVPCLGYEEAFSPSEAEWQRANFPDYWRGGEPGSRLQSHYGVWKVGELEAGWAHHVLPLSPMWPGLLANTAFYGGAWAVLIGATVLPTCWFVRRRRARRGGCPQCGYSREGLKVDAPCPECGRATPAARDATTTPTAR